MPSQTNLASTYVLLVFIWATTPLAIVWSVSDLHVMWALLLRFYIALPLSVIVLLVLKTSFPTHKQALHSYFAGSFSLMFGLAPIMAGLIGRFAFGQHLFKLQWLGMAVAVCGLAIICLNGSNQHVHPFGIVLMLVSVFVYSFSIFWVKKVNAKIQPMAQATGSILVSSILASCLIPFIWQYAPTHLPQAKSLFALIYTVLMASLVAMFCYFKLVQNIKPTTLSLTTVITPMLAMIIGAVLNHEQLSIMVFVGAFIILFGLFLYFYKDIQANRNFAQHIKSK